MATFVYPTNRELTLIAQELTPRLTADRPVFAPDMFPIQDSEAFLISWEQRDNYTGLQQLRGLDGAPSRVKQIQGRRYDMLPGVYGEYMTIDEEELTLRRPLGQFNGVVDISDLVRERQDRLLGRRFDRLELIVWTLLLTGTFSVALPYGVGVGHTDSYTTQTFTAGTPWSTIATATPLSDLRQVRVLGRGHGVQFNAGAKAFANYTTINNMLNNTNANDLFGRRQNGLSTINNLNEVNQLIMGDDLPPITPYEQGYLDDTGTFQLFIPNGKIVVMGQRARGQMIGCYRMVRNAQNPNFEPGAYMKVIDNGDRKVPRTVEVHDGHNGGPVIYYPSSIVVMNV